MLQFIHLNMSLNNTLLSCTPDSKLLLSLAHISPNSIQNSVSKCTFALPIFHPVLAYACYLIFLLFIQKPYLGDPVNSLYMVPERAYFDHSSFVLIFTKNKQQLCNFLYCGHCLRIYIFHISSHHLECLMLAPSDIKTDVQPHYKSHIPQSNSPDS